MKSKSLHSSIQLPIQTKDGSFLATYSSRGLASLRFPPTPANPPTAEHTAQGEPGLRSPEVGTWHRTTTAAVKDVLAGRAPKEIPPLDLSSGTAFQRSAWSALARVAPGRTVSYAQLAKIIGKPKAARAVGGACGANPIPLLIPCHRVLASHGRLGGFSGGLEWKRRLLEREGITAKAA